MLFKIQLLGYEQLYLYNLDKVIPTDAINYFTFIV